MYRSGSTWQYNAARLIAGSGHRCGTFEGKKSLKEEFRELMETENFVLKTHPFVDDIFTESSVIDVVVLTSYRDLRDVAASMKRKFGTCAPYNEMLREIVVWHQKWAKVSAYNMRYEDMMSDPVSEVKKISDSMRVWVDAEAINKHIGGFKEPLLGVDPVTQLHAGHKTDGKPGSYAGTLGQENIRDIEAEFGGWFVEHGYDPGSWNTATTAVIGGKK